MAEDEKSSGWTAGMAFAVIFGVLFGIAFFVIIGIIIKKYMESKNPPPRRSNRTFL